MFNNNWNNPNQKNALLTATAFLWALVNLPVAEKDSLSRFDFIRCKKERLLYLHV
jgi:hypothetical protein